MDAADFEELLSELESSLAGLGDAQVAGETSFPGVSARVFLEETSV